MNTLKLTLAENKKKTITYPSKWEEVTVRQYRELQDFQDAGTARSIRNRVKIISVLLSIDEDLVFTFPPDKFAEIESSLTWVLKPMTVEEDTEYVEMDGEKYFLNQDFKSYAIGEIVSIEMLIEKSKGNLLTVYNELLCIFLRKKLDDGTLEPYSNSMMARAAMFDNVPIGKINSMMVFFSSTASQYA